MTNQMDFDKLGELFAQIERAWLDHHDRRIVHSLSEKYPEFREELCEFFEDLVLGPNKPAEEISKAEERVSQWIFSSGFEIATAASALSRSTPQTTGATPSVPDPSPQNEASGSPDKGETVSSPQGEDTNWVFFLRKRTNQTLTGLARELPNVTTEYLILVSRHPNVVPSVVKRHIAKEVEKAWGIPTRESFEYLSDNPKLMRAASRSEPFGKNPKTFSELLDRAAFTSEQKDFWLQYSKSNR